MMSIKRLAFGLTLVAFVACSPVALTWCLGMVIRDRLRAANRVVVRHGHARKVTLTCFVPRQSSWWGRA